MSMRVSYKKQALVMLMLLGVFIVVVELAVNVWLYNFYRCSFEEKEVFKDVDPEINRKVCIQSLGNNVFNEAIFKTPGTTKEINKDLVYFQCLIKVVKVLLFDNQIVFPIHKF